MTAPTAVDGESFNLFISDWEDAPARLPAGVSAWAIGDIHGHLTHLEAMLGAVTRLIAAAPAGPRHLVFLGDTIDRGPDNIATLERVAGLTMPGVTVTALWGNHEQFLDRLLYGDMGAEVGAEVAAEVGAEDFIAFWSANGGLATLANLGVEPADIGRLGARAAIDQVRATAPASVGQALGSLSSSLRLGGYLFVHAGVHPRHALADIANQRLTTIREPFLSGDGWIHDFAVVHGHTIAGPDIRSHRIAVDSGVYRTGILTCVELRDDRARFICATPDDSLEALSTIRNRRPLSAETWRRLPP